MVQVVCWIDILAEFELTIVGRAFACWRDSRRAEGYSSDQFRVVPSDYCIQCMQMSLQLESPTAGWRSMFAGSYHPKD